MDNKGIRYFIWGLIIILIFSACCTMKYCGYEDYPSLRVKLVAFNDSRIGYVKVIDNTNKQMIDSFMFHANSFRIKHIKDEFDIRGKTYHICSDDDRVDTIANIDFEIFEFYNSCNNCFLSDNGEIAIDFKNLKFSLNGVVFNDTEDVNISE